MMNELIENARKIAQLGQESNFEQAQNMLMEYLKNNMEDTQAWLLLVRIECNSPFDDYDRIVHYAEHILSYDPSNAYAALFLSYAEYYMRGSLDDGLYNKLNMAYNSDPEIMSMIELAKARHFEHRDAIKCAQALKKSIEYCSTYVANFCMLGRLFIEQGKEEEGDLLIKQGAKNVKKMVTAENACRPDPTDIGSFLAEFFAGTTVTSLWY
jgi:tetratricopeptide (TPR) repeat protein